MINILQQFQVGQKVCIREMGAGWHVQVISVEQDAPVLVEVNPEYIVLDDDAAGVKMRIPVHLIRTGELPAEFTATPAAA